MVDTSRSVSHMQKLSMICRTLLEGCIQPTITLGVCASEHVQAAEGKEAAADDSGTTCTLRSVTRNALGW